MREKGVFSPTQIVQTPPTHGHLFGSGFRIRRVHARKSVRRTNFRQAWIDQQRRTHDGACTANVHFARF
jgi:hypothetical protein